MKETETHVLNSEIQYTALAKNLTWKNRWMMKLAEFVESILFNNIIMGLLVLDVLFVLGEIMITLFQGL